jgi:hypothetical protein
MNVTEVYTGSLDEEFTLMTDDFVGEEFTLMTAGGRSSCGNMFCKAAKLTLKREVATSDARQLGS